jgi:hypothetical protein
MTVEQPIGWVPQVRDGRLVRGRVSFRPVEALEAVGLSEQDAHADSRACGILRGRCRRDSLQACRARKEEEPCTQ